ncbi:unnamed protein product [Clonostachys rosea]|uniref:Uncharacterized protein n=1 Tax=Bionectria ochroleuca TaxID=29856 RepID=A0ABY6U4W4_BIOOC|nr:unnamed protein product [Clonostachys rosea]
MAWLYTYDLYNASRGRVAPACEPIAGSILNLPGFAAGKIQKTGPLFGVYCTREEILAVIGQWQDIVRQFSGEAGPYPGGGTYKGAFWRVLVADMVAEGMNEEATRKIAYRRAREDDEAQCRENWGALDIRARGKILIVTDNVMIGLGPAEAEVSDDVYVLFGGRMPFVLRSTDKGLQFIGQAYIHGIMDGEIIDKAQEASWVSLT